MNWNNAIFQVISLHTFSNVWYWLAVIVTWAVASHWILGVPFDMIYRAKRLGGEAEDDLEALVAINVRRLTQITDMAGPGLAGLTAFILAGLATAGFYYGLEIAKGVFCLGLPLTLTGMLSFRQSRRFAVEQPVGKDLVRSLLRLRLAIQTIAMISIFVTVIYGMYSRLNLPLDL